MGRPGVSWREGRRFRFDMVLDVGTMSNPNRHPFRRTTRRGVRPRPCVWTTRTLDRRTVCSGAMPPSSHALAAARLCLDLVRLEARHAGLNARLDAVRAHSPLESTAQALDQALSHVSPHEHVRVLAALAGPVRPLHQLFGPEDEALRAPVVDRFLQEAEVRLRVHAGPVLAFEPGPEIGIRAGTDALPSGAAALPARIHAWMGGGLALLLASGDADRLRRCASRRCRQPFLDSSRGRRQRFCRPACANTAALARQRAR